MQPTYVGYDSGCCRGGGPEERNEQPGMMGTNLGFRNSGWHTDWPREREKKKERDTPGGRPFVRSFARPETGGRPFSVLQPRYLRAFAGRSLSRSPGPLDGGGGGGETEGGQLSSAQSVSQGNAPSLTSRTRTERTDTPEGPAGHWRRRRCYARNVKRQNCPTFGSLGK